MDNVSLLNFTKVFSNALLKKSEKLIVRDIDEESKNHFVAYVDESDNSYDVKIVLNAKKEIIDSSCDCENNIGFCIHKVGLIISLASNKSAQLVKTVRKRKQTETEILLDNASFEEVKIWMSEIFKKNKDLELLFFNEFRASNESFSAEEIKVLIKTTFKSVLKNRKNIDASQLKKILEVLESSLNPVMKNIEATALKPETMQLFEAVMQGLIDFEENVYVNSVKIQRYIEKLGSEYLSAIYNIKDETLWKAICIKAFAVFLPIKSNTVHLYHIKFVQDLYDKIPDDVQKKIFYVEQWILWFKTSGSFVDINTFIIKICLELNIFEQHYTHFKPVKYQNDYNELLFEALMRIEKYDLVATYCKVQIDSNHDKKYNKAYYGFLKTIYKLQGNDDELMKIAMNSILVDYDFETYLYVKKNLPEQFIAFKSNIYKNSHNYFHGLKGKSELFFMNIFIEENDIQAILKYLTEIRNLQVLNDLFEPLMNINKKILLHVICSVDYLYDFPAAEKERSIALFKQFYTREDITFISKQVTLRRYGHIYSEIISI